jgi:hypothetical protein
MSAHIEADVDLVDAQRMRRERGLDLIGQMIVEAGSPRHELSPSST